MKKYSKSWKQKITVIMVCILMVSVTNIHIVFAVSENENNLSSVISSQIEDAPIKINEAVNGCEEVEPDGGSVELKAGQRASLPGVLTENSGFNAAITGNGDLYCWGNNETGLVGNGTTVDQSTPVKVLSNVTSASVSGDSDIVSVITSNGDLYCWGANDCGQVGNGTTVDQHTPVKVLSNVISVFNVEAGGRAVTSNGDLYCWGANDCGQVGNGTTVDQHTPVKVLSNVTSVSVYDYTTVRAITSNGDLCCWGANDCGQVGNGTTVDQSTPVKVLSNVTSISGSSNTVRAITNNGDLYCWGANNCGQVGNGTTTDQSIPVRVLNNVTSVSSTIDFSSDTVRAITSNGDLYCWGSNSYGLVGNGAAIDQSTPVKVLSNVTSVSVYDYTTVRVITSNGDLYCWGKNDYGQVGNGTTVDQSTPVKVLSNVVSVSVFDYGYSDRNGSTVGAVTSNGDLYCWGKNNYGQVGNGTATDQSAPVKVLSGVAFVSVYENSSTIGAVTSNGDLYCWGANECGQVGNGTNVDQYTPVKVLSNVTSVYSDNNGSGMGAITGDGDLYRWGINYCGQVGNGTTTAQYTPVRVLNLVPGTMEPFPGKDILDNIAGFTLDKASSGLFGGNIVFFGRIYLEEGETAGEGQWEEIINSIIWTSSDKSVTGEIKCSSEPGDMSTYSSRGIIVTLTPNAVGTAMITGTLPNDMSQACEVTVAVTPATETPSPSPTETPKVTITENPDGSKTETTVSTVTNPDGSTFHITETVNKAANGKVTSSSVKTTISTSSQGSGSPIAVTVSKDGRGTITNAVAKLTNTASSGKQSALISGSMVRQITQAAGTKQVNVSIKNQNSSSANTIIVNTADLAAGKKLYITAKKTGGAYVLVNAKTYTVAKNGNLYASVTGKGTYEFINSSRMNALSKKILKTIKTKKASKTIKKSRTAKMDLKNTLNMANVKSITYSVSKKSVASVTKKGVIKGKKAGTAVVKAKVTLKNGRTKTVKMKIKVKK